MRVEIGVEFDREPGPEHLERCAQIAGDLLGDQDRVRVGQIEAPGRAHPLVLLSLELARPRSESDVASALYPRFADALAELEGFEGCFLRLAG